MKNSIFCLLSSAVLLFSCAKDSTVVTNPEENLTNLSLTISGKAQMSPVASKATATESKVNSATAFVFRGSLDNAILDCAPFTLSTTGVTTTGIVTSEAQWVFILANSTADYSGVKTLGDLKALTAQLYNGTSLSQQESSLTMWGSNVINKTNAIYTSDVVLRFAPAKVTLHYTVNGANAADLTSQNVTVFNAQGTTRLFPTNTVASSKADYMSLLPSASALNYFAGSSMESFGVKPASYTVAAPLTNSSTDKGTYTYYLFENDETHPTIIAISGVFGGKTLHYPISFSQTDSGANVSEFEAIKSGRQYDITININNIFAGSNDPTQPNSSQEIEVTVVPADWETVITWIKDFE